MESAPKVIDQIVSVLETGRLLTSESYGTVAVLGDGAGFSYGKHQSTDRAGSLDAIVLRYLDYGGQINFRPFLDELAANATATLSPLRATDQPRDWPSWAVELRELLQEAGKDPIMQQAQDDIFTEMYWQPAERICEAAKLELPLSYLAVYDTCIQSDASRVAALRLTFPELPPSRRGKERAWTTAFVRARHTWLKTFEGRTPAHTTSVRRSAYRTAELLKLIDDDRWYLSRPRTVRGVQIT